MAPGPSLRGAWSQVVTAFRSLDMNAVIVRLGRDWRYVGRGWPVCCAVCGSRLMIRIAGDQRGPAERERKNEPLSSGAVGRTGLKVAGRKGVDQRGPRSIDSRATRRLPATRHGRGDCPPRSRLALPDSAFFDERVAQVTWRLAPRGERTTPSRGTVLRSGGKTLH